MVLYYHRPLNTMYGDNYRYGTSLYTPGVDDVEKKYRNTLSRTHLRSDRGDLGLYTFAGSHLHGGTPAAEKVTGPKVTGSTGPITSSKIPDRDLYAPLEAASYGRGYYDHLRATTPEPRKRVPKSTGDTFLDDYDFKPSMKIPSYDFEYKTLPTKITSDYDYDSDRKKTVTKTTTTTEHWVPLTTHIYHTPYHTYYYKATPYSSYTYRSADDLYSYNYLDDYKKISSSTTTTRTKNIDALDLSTTSKSYESFDYNHYMNKCSEIQKQLDEVNKWVAEAESKIKSEVVTSRNKIQTELAEVSMIVEDTARYNEDLYKAIKKQSKQISTLSSQYESINRNISEVADTMEKSRMRCQTLQSDLSSVQSGLEMAFKRRL